MTAPLKIDTLPKWAQSHIRNLEMRLQEAKAHIRDITEHPPSPFKWQPDPMGPYVNLPEKRNIRVVLPNNQYLDICVKASQDDRLTVYADYGLMVQPCAHNTLELIPEGR